jgi:hypothetical protein
MARAAGVRSAMIRYKLTCQNGDDFEAWFRSSADFDVQADSKLIGCPVCGDCDVRKAPMAPAIVRGKSEPSEAPPTPMVMAERLAAHVRDHFDYVGDRFPAEARAIHSGDADDRPIWGEASADEARAMAEEGIPVAPLPAGAAPVPPKKLN